MTHAATPLPDCELPVRMIDRDHFARMTSGDSALEQQLLDLFDRQAAILLTRMDGAPAASLATLAHTLKGSATGIGAWGVARAAEVLERAAGPSGSPAERSLAVADLTAAVGEARSEIDAWLRGSRRSGAAP